ncbi:MAG: GNAT family N-acetyltransferase [Nitrospirae bacterium]|nr:GNAT family N-acetyltransferase [Nitrospirota bacterium]
MKISAISTFEGLSGIESSWKRIFRESGSANIFLSWEWSSLWLKHFVSDGGIFVLKVEDDGDVVGIAPMIVVRGQVCFIGGGLADYTDFLILRDQRKVIAAILDFIFTKTDWVMISFPRIPESSPNLLPLRELLSGIAYPSRVRAVGVSPCVRITGTWDDYYKGTSKGLRQDIRTAHNKFRSMGETTYEDYNENNSEELLNCFFEMHRKRQAGKIGESLYETQVNMDFFSELASAFHATGWSDFSVLKIDGRIISAVFAFKYHRIFFYWIPVFAPEFLKYSPGKVHIQILLKKCFEEGFREFDFMRGDESYKYKWADGSASSYEVKIYRSRSRYRLDSMKDRARGSLRNMYNRNPLFRKILIRFSKMTLLSHLRQS